MFGGEHKVRPYDPPNVGANLVFALYAQKLPLARIYYYPAISCFLCTLFMQPFP
ncbi:MAG: hypothetical protein BECKG1743E_GA0114224_108212 [Candidatus Kentron sp. G]|nr:MAG: hypothetical protein BECKG1743E_GA0114224_108212 [Candidatus Kentron sp. G]